jgi:hypothetical protein
MTKTGARQHIVPQQMIRRFAGDDGMLVGLQKAPLRVERKRRSPRSILYIRDYYVGNADFDSAWLKPIEDRFATLYPRLVGNSNPPEHVAGDDAESFLDWCLSQLCRTSLIDAQIRAVAALDTEVVQAVFEAGGKDLLNLLRLRFFQEMKNLCPCSAPLDN